MIVKCKKCRSDVSDKAKQCPHCGNVINTNSNDTSSFIIGLIFIGIIVFIVMSIGSSVKQDAEYRKQRELREFNTQLHQDPSTWDKEQRDRYDSFIKWDSDNK